MSILSPTLRPSSWLARRHTGESGINMVNKQSAYHLIISIPPVQVIAEYGQWTICRALNKCSRSRFHQGLLLVENTFFTFQNQLRHQQGAYPGTVKLRDGLLTALQRIVDNNLQSTRTSSDSEVPTPMSFSATHSQAPDTSIVLSSSTGPDMVRILQLQTNNFQFSCRKYAGTFRQLVAWENYKNGGYFTYNDNQRTVRQCGWHNNKIEAAAIGQIIPASCLVMF